MATYTRLVRDIRLWANRDKEVLPSDLIKIFINMAADNIYRELRIPPLEYVLAYDTVSDSEAGDNKIIIPSDAIEFIQLRKKSDNSLTGYDIYAAKSDIRSFYEDTTTKYDYFYYTREGGNLVVHPEFQAGEEYELYYYRRLPEMDARYPVDSETRAVAGLVIPRSELTDSDFDADPDLNSNDTEFGALVPNWIRDENQKLILFGALVEVFTYLDEMESIQKYAQRFQNEMAKLNEEEHNRQYMGGVIQAHYKSRLI